MTRRYRFRIRVFQCTPVQYMQYRNQKRRGKMDFWSIDNSANEGYAAAK